MIKRILAALGLVEDKIEHALASLDAAVKRLEGIAATAKARTAQIDQEVDDLQDERETVSATAEDAAAIAKRLSALTARS